MNKEQELVELGWKWAVTLKLREVSLARKDFAMVNECERDLLALKQRAAELNVENLDYFETKR